MPLSGVFDTQTGPLVLVGALKANPLRDICTALGIDHLSAGARFSGIAAHPANVELHAIFRERFAGNTRDHWLAKLEEQDVLSAACATCARRLSIRGRCTTTGVVTPAVHPLANRASVSLKDCARYPFLRSSSHPAISAGLSPEFAALWDDMEPAATGNSTPMLKRLIMAGEGIQCFSEIAFIEDLKRGDLIWRPFKLPALDQLQVGIVVPSQRVLPRATLNFVSAMARRLTHWSLQMLRRELGDTGVFALFAFQGADGPA